MIGIYKITNLSTGQTYVGQSVDIHRRWQEHCRPSKNNKSLIAKAISEFGKENFSFQILEECLTSELDDKEKFYIEKYNCVYPNGYNSVAWVNSNRIQNIGYSNDVVFQIISDLTETVMSFSEIAEKNKVDISTVSRINSGKTHFQEKITYPIRKTFVKPKEKKPVIIKENRINLCPHCGRKISSDAKRCSSCYKEERQLTLPKRDILKEKIRTMSFVQIGKEFGVTDNAVRKWCDRLSLPRSKKEIKAYSDEEWENI